MKPRDFIGRYLIDFLKPFKVFPTKLTDKSDLIDFIPRLYPYQSNVDLIRIGGSGDGGYLIPNDLEGIQYCVSPGVGELSYFENDCANLGMKVLMADYSVEGPKINHPNFQFTKKFIGARSYDHFINLGDWVNQSINPNDNDLLLQMDIEGAEYEVLATCSSDFLNRFRIMSIEFHFLHQIFNYFYFPVIREAFLKILETHTIVHIHPNNCCPSTKLLGFEVPPILEFTFLRNDRIKDKKYASEFPHPLDSDNINSKKMILPKTWYYIND